MAKGFLGGLRGIDAFGKVNLYYAILCHVGISSLALFLRLDHRRRESEDADWGSLYVQLHSFGCSNSYFGFLVTLISACIILAFTTMEFFDYRRVGVDTSIVVDRSRGQKLSVKLNVTFPHVPCYCK